MLEIDILRYYFPPKYETVSSFLKCNFKGFCVKMMTNAVTLLDFNWLGL